MKTTPTTRRSDENNTDDEHNHANLNFHGEETMTNHTLDATNSTPFPSHFQPTPLRPQTKVAGRSTSRSADSTIYPVSPQPKPSLVAPLHPPDYTSAQPNLARPMLLLPLPHTIYTRAILSRVHLRLYLPLSLPFERPSLLPFSRTPHRLSPPCDPHPPLFLVYTIARLHHDRQITPA